MKTTAYWLLCAAIALSVISWYPPEGFAQLPASTERVAKVVSVQGIVEIRKVGQTTWLTVRLNDSLYPGDMLRVRERSRADLLLSNEAVVRLDQKTTVSISEFKKGQSFLMNLLDGIIYFFSRTPRSISISTPLVNGTIKGTEFVLRSDEQETFLALFEGEVSVESEAGSLSLTSGQTAFFAKGHAPEMRVLLRPRDAVQWALYYPPVLYAPPADLDPSAATWQTLARKSDELFTRGDLAGALETLQQVPADVTDPRFLCYKASVFLAVGRADEAAVEIKKALAVKPHYTDALALLAVIALVQDTREEAFLLAKKAVDADTSSTSARIALSYVQQARFDLKGALDTIKQASESDPVNALAQARLAELLLSFRYLGEALEAARRAVTLEPNLGRTQTVLGYAYLTQLRITEAKQAFTKAIELDQGDPLPRLGLGLAKIHDGELDAGRSELEIAVSLDPNNSLVRSYLGKAYFEEKRDDKASMQFDAAEKLDPADPTSWFYDAIMKQTVNRPVEALHDLQEAIKLNDNRAIYRSKLLLDSDLAARSANLGRIFDNLGFQQLGLVEGWQSVDTDPSDYSAHRFLSDTYAALRRHEIARTSELLKSQLLQPINITPLQPQLAETNLLMLGSAGPTALSYSEYTPLFNRNRMALQADGIIGGNSTYGEELIVSGVYDRFSFSLGQFHYETNGFRPNNDLTKDIYDAFIQMSLSYNTSIQAEFRSTTSKYGDLSLQFDPGKYSKDLRQKDEVVSVRFGFRHDFSPSSTLIGNVSYANTNNTLSNIMSFVGGPIIGLNGTIRSNGYSVEVQNICQFDWGSLIGGISYTTMNQDNTQTLSPGPTTSGQTDIDHTDAYIYALLNAASDLTITLGASVDFLSYQLPDRNQFNPKLGFTWKPLPDTTIRAAIFRMLRSPFIYEQTIEPTQVAGFNQFYDDAFGTSVWQYGMAVDQRFSTNLFGGIEYFIRDLTVPYTVTTLSGPGPSPVVVNKETDWTERTGRAYLYWTPHKWWALRIEYLYEKLERSFDFNVGVKELKTQRIPMGFGFFHPCGFFATATATYVTQDGVLSPQLDLSLAQPVSSYFWIVDGMIGYRFPKRFGIATLGVTNLLDKKFFYQEMDLANPSYKPKRFVYGRLTLSF